MKKLIMIIAIILSSACSQEAKVENQDILITEYEVPAVDGSIELYPLDISGKNVAIIKIDAMSDSSANCSIYLKGEAEDREIDRHFGGNFGNDGHRSVVLYKADLELDVQWSIFNHCESDFTVKTMEW